MIEAKTLWKYREILRYNPNLIHCITNPISMNDCANAVLALGAKVIMAQHPEECAQITKQSKALAVNLGNFDDTRATAMRISGSVAKEFDIPIILDIVGVGCSELRKQYADAYSKDFHPAIIKGNLSELKTMTSLCSHAQGIDVGNEDKEDIHKSAVWLQHLAKSLQCVILCSGESDIVTDGTQTVYLHNGTALLTLITGTGCMLNALGASFLSVCPPLESAILACAYQGIAAEVSQQSTQVPGTFHSILFDNLYGMEEETFISLLKMEQANGSEEHV